MSGKDALKSLLDSFGNCRWTADDAKKDFDNFNARVYEKPQLVTANIGGRDEEFVFITISQLKSLLSESQNDES